MEDLEAEIARTESIMREAYLFIRLERYDYATAEDTTYGIWNKVWINKGEILTKDPYAVKQIDQGGVR